MCVRVCITTAQPGCLRVERQSGPQVPLGRPSHPKTSPPSSLTCPRPRCTGCSSAVCSVSPACSAPPQQHTQQDVITASSVSAAAASCPASVRHPPNDGCRAVQLLQACHTLWIRGSRSLAGPLQDSSAARSTPLMKSTHLGPPCSTTVAHRSVIAVSSTPTANPFEPQPAWPWIEFRQPGALAPPSPFSAGGHVVGKRWQLIRWGTLLHATHVTPLAVSESPAQAGLARSRCDINARRNDQPMLLVMLCTSSSPYELLIT